MITEKFYVFVGGSLLGWGLATVAILPAVIFPRKPTAPTPCQCACQHPAGVADPPKLAVPSGEPWDARPHMAAPSPGARLQSGDPIPSSDPDKDYLP